MTRNEFNAFVDRELKARWSRWDPTEAILDDWYAILRYHTRENAVAAIQQHRLDDKASAFEPKIGAVNRILRAMRKATVASEATRFDPSIRCLTAPEDHPEWENQEWLRLDRFRRSDCWNRVYVANYASAMAELVEAAEGGKWCGVVRPEDQLCEGQPRLHGLDAKTWALNHVRNGPDGPGRRFASELHGDGPLRPLIKGIPALPKPKTTATAEDLRRLTCTPLVTGSGPIAFDPADPEFSTDPAEDPECDGEWPWECG